jgi:hypothetical protein
VVLPVANVAPVAFPGALPADDAVTAPMRLALLPHGRVPGPAAAGGLLGYGAGTGALGDQAGLVQTPAKAKKKKPRKARIRYVRNVSRVPSGVRFSIRKPQLIGGTEKARRAFSYKVEAAITDEIRYQARAKRACKPDPHLVVRGKSKAVIYQKKFASAAITFSGNWCKSAYTKIRAFTVNVRTGKIMKRGAFTALDSKTLEQTAKARMGAAEKAKRPGKAIAWTVEKNGLRLYFQAGSKAATALIPWAQTRR